MPNYVVRYCKEINPHEPVIGIFACSDLIDLCDLIDELADPFGCEYSKIGSFGFEMTGFKIGDFSNNYEILDTAYRSSRDKMKWKPLESKAWDWYKNFNSKSSRERE